ncbi:Proline 4-hydroxylase (includes Rps23 Pro-64 3,4-dihydroxylase Tpa1), contains SM-20 domain [Sphingomonas laterariae]|uniref:Proline 4-hydroxylase (Includes Rps23 Pro-64 3,4-dihydroxylase Tpa1), contains SM-20 domain n=1 Tax=Edaphosphingomonas laterariae TaxID=861865 RepID=A0A239GNF4_9SPHN|nr:2OG-Fe(II) oxygenase [Sphingomonas laterariae]SNS70405.1 Proline 4-hydroxylase (includes Rps23 Pro-64 3,4-dihydroxylase Tpa1), contains SM-20 domain [Sphingomonas laterariae]
MPVLTVREVGNYLHFDADECQAAGEARAAAYAAANPFPHAVIDDFLDAGLLRRVLSEFPSTTGRNHFNRDQERLKYQFHPNTVESGLVRNLLAELNSDAFIRFVEAISGIKGLIPDPYYLGGGLHEIRTGGHLSVHADFNIHGRMQVERRLNLLIYLNEDWPEEYGGNLELWDKEMKARQHSVAPLLGRAVLFNTALDSFHGHPEPLACPPDRARRSIALYYYTAFPDGAGAVPERTTVFRPRPGTHDRTDWQVKRHHFVNDWVPRRLQPLTRKVMRRVGLG